MPNWKIHVEIGMRLNEYLKYNEEDLNLFLLGSVLPDINNGWIVPDVSKIIEHDITHIGSYIDASYYKFYDKYKYEINRKNPLFLGYMVHIYTDAIWNKDFYTSVKKLNIKAENLNELKLMKQSDFKVYKNKFITNIIEIRNIDKALKEIEKIDTVSVTKEDILKSVEFLKNEEIYKFQYKFYTESRLDKLMDDTINGYIELLKENKII